MGAPELALGSLLLLQTCRFLLMLFVLFWFPLLRKKAFLRLVFMFFLCLLLLLLLMGYWPFKIGIIDLSAFPKTPSTVHTIAEVGRFRTRIGYQTTTVVTSNELDLVVHSLVKR